MKILRFNDDRIGVLKAEDRVIDVSSLITYREERGPQRTMEVFIETFEKLRPEIDRMVAAGEGVALSSVKLLAPVPRPSKCLGAFLNYLDAPDRKLELLPNEFFHKAPELVGPEGDIVLRNVTAAKEVNPEAELAFVIGKHAKDVSEADAMDYVFGYTGYFDVSMRGLIRRSLIIPKGQDTFGPCGPWIVTRDEIPDPHNLNVKSWVSGELRQDYNTRDMAHKIPDQLSWLSQWLQLQPGDVIATGTHHKGLLPLNVGNTLEIEIEKIGRARWHVKGDMPFKDTKKNAAAKKPDPLPEGMLVTPV
jgi:2-keto-4-pentenoate hydratase/2-oxohepta-3-ene-1,7-dioic acid hydratase in catechol pathway